MLPGANDAAEAGFDDSFIYNELKIPQGERKIPLRAGNARRGAGALPGMGAERATASGTDRESAVDCRKKFRWKV